MLIDALSYSLIPVLAALNADKGDPVIYYAMALVVACAVYQPFLKRGSLKRVKLRKETVKLILYCGLTYIGAQLVLIYSLRDTTNSYIPTIVYQMYPLWIVGFSFLLKVSSEKLDLRKLILMGLASSGILFLYPENGSVEFNSLTSLILPLIASASVGLTVSYVGVLTHHLEENYGIDHEDSPIISNYCSRIASLIVIAPLALWILIFENPKTSLESIGIATAYGVFPMAFGAVFYFKGIRLASNSLSIHMISYISFVLAVLWIGLLGMGELTKPILIGASFIIASNILLNLKAESSYSFNAAIGGLLIIGSMLYYVSPSPFSNFYDSLSVLLIFFTIMLAFLLDRMIKKTEEEEFRILALINTLSSEGDVDNETRNTIAKISSYSFRDKIHRNYSKLIRSLPEKAQKELNLFMLSRSYSISFSEIFILILVGFFIVFLSIFFRPEGFVHSSFSLIISTAVVFNIAYVFDKKSYRERQYIKSSHSDDDPMTVVFQEEAVASKLQQIVSASMICILLIFFFLIFAM
jgi:drug/metabolite transporter (DMT)-like permease